MTRFTEAVALLVAMWSTSAAAAEPSNVRRVGKLLTIEARGAPRVDVAVALAALSATSLEGQGAVALAQAGPLTLSWRGSSAQEAWQAVLDGVVNHAVQCTPRRCRVWLLADTRPAAAAPGSAATTTATFSSGPPIHPITPDPPGLFPNQ